MHSWKCDHLISSPQIGLIKRSTKRAVLLILSPEGWLLVPLVEVGTGVGQQGQMAQSSIPTESHHVQHGLLHQRQLLELQGGRHITDMDLEAGQGTFHQ